MGVGQTEDMTFSGKCIWYLDRVSLQSFHIIRFGERNEPFTLFTKTTYLAQCLPSGRGLNSFVMFSIKYPKIIKNLSFCLTSFIVTENKVP